MLLIDAQLFSNCESNTNYNMGLQSFDYPPTLMTMQINDEVGVTHVTFRWKDYIMQGNGVGCYQNKGLPKAEPRGPAI